MKINQRAAFFALLCLLSLLLPALAQEAGGAVATTEASVPANLSLLDLLLKGGVMMIPLAIASIIMLTIALERLISLRRSRVVPRDFLPGLQKAMGPQARNEEAGLTFCNQHDCATGRMFRSAILNLRRGEAAAEKAMEDTAANEIDKLKRRHRGLSTVASVAPLLGLLGTVIGMIGAFQSAMVDEAQKADTLAQGIYEALVTTATGLSIAIPALLLSHYFSNKVTLMADEMNEMGGEFMLYASRHATPSQRSTTPASSSTETTPAQVTAPATTPPPQYTGGN